jgi:hypothetical protein
MRDILRSAVSFSEVGCFSSDVVDASTLSILLTGMHRPGADCRELTQETASALDGDVLQRLFVANQQNNLELSIEYAVKQ